MVELSVVILILRATYRDFLTESPESYQNSRSSSPLNPKHGAWFHTESDITSSTPGVDAPENIIPCADREHLRMSWGRLYDLTT